MSLGQIPVVMDLHIDGLVEDAIETGGWPACLEGNQESLVKLFQKEIAREYIYNALIELVHAGCSDGDSKSCVALATMHEEGIGFKGSSFKASRIIEDVCDQGDVDVCFLAVISYEQDKAIREAIKIDSPFPRPASLYEKACNRGHGGACNQIGWNYQDGKDVPKSEAKAVIFFRRSCDAGDMFGCDSLGFMLQNGKGAERDEKQAVALFEKSCNGDCKEACYNLGLMQYFGRGTAPDKKRAAEAFRLGCEEVPLEEVAASCIEDDDRERCGIAGLLYALGGCGAPDRKHASELLRKGCKDGYTWSCDRFRDLGGSL